VDRLVREYRDERGKELEYLEALARKLKVPEDKAEDVIIAYLAYRLSVGEAEARLRELAGRAKGKRAKSKIRRSRKPRRSKRRRGG